MSKTWFITGASKGFGREWTEAALERGDNVAGTARKLETIQELADKYADTFLPIQLDVTDREAGFAAVQKAAEHFGRLDVVVNNAGYGHFGMIRGTHRSGSPGATGDEPVRRTVDHAGGTSHHA